MVNTTNTTIYVEREDAPLVDTMRAYRVIVDGEERARVRSGANVVIDVDPGRHVIEMKVDWCSSPSLSLDVPHGGQIRVHCRPPANQFAALYHLLFARSRYITLRQL